MVRIHSPRLIAAGRRARALLPAFVSLGSRRITCGEFASTGTIFSINFGETDMGDRGGSKDKGKREKQKKAQLTPKEKRQLKKAKKK